MDQAEDSEEEAEEVDLKAKEGAIEEATEVATLKITINLFAISSRKGIAKKEISANTIILKVTQVKYFVV